MNRIIAAGLFSSRGHLYRWEKNVLFPRDSGLMIREGCQQSAWTLLSFQPELCDVPVNRT